MGFTMFIHSDEKGELYYTYEKGKRLSFLLRKGDMEWRDATRIFSLSEHLKDKRKEKVEFYKEWA